MAFERFRPKSHFIAPHSWSNDPCGAVYIPETEEYIICYQWNPGTTKGGNSAWGMARSKDLVTWEDCPPAIRNGSSYDSQGVFSGSIVSKLVKGKRVLFLYYTSVSALPIHWSKPYIKGCESQSVAISQDFGRSWHRYLNNPILKNPPKLEATTGWRDPFVSLWPSLSTLLGIGRDTEYMLLASGERNVGSQLQLYRSSTLGEWHHVSILLEVDIGARVSKDSPLRFGLNFECASFFSIGGLEYIIVGIEEDETSHRHNGHYNLWLSGKLRLENGQPKFEIFGHGLLDHGISYAPHIFRDAEQQLTQLGWADEAARGNVVEEQGWAGCLVHPRELFEISRRQTDIQGSHHEWVESSKSGGYAVTLGIRPSAQVMALRSPQCLTSLDDFEAMTSTNFEVEAIFKNIGGTERIAFDVRKTSDSSEVTRVIFDLGARWIEVDRSRSSLAHLGTSTPDAGAFHLLSGEDLHVRIFVDVSIIEVFVNDRFALTSRIYPTSDTAVFASCNLGNVALENLEFRCWPLMKDAWPCRKNGNTCGEKQPRTELELKHEIDRLKVTEVVVS